MNRDPLVASWSGESFANVQIDGVTVPALIAKPHAAVAPPLIAGHELDATNQIVLGAQTMAQLHKHIGDTVVGSYGSPHDTPVYVPPTKFVIVGTATFPAIGPALSLHPSMGVGAVIPEGVESKAMVKFLRQKYAVLNGPKIVLIRLRRGVSMAAGKKSLERIVAAGNRAFAAAPNGAGVGDSVELLGVQYPAEIENYRTIGATPAVLALALAAGAVVALGITLNASVRRRRRDLAMLRALGFRSRQLRAAVAWQASVNGLVGVVFGSAARHRARVAGCGHFSRVTSTPCQNQRFPSLSIVDRWAGDHGSGEHHRRAPGQERGPHVNGARPARRVTGDVADDLTP